MNSLASALLQSLDAEALVVGALELNWLSRAAVLLCALLSVLLIATSRRNQQLYQCAQRWHRERVDSAAFLKSADAVSMLLEGAAAGVCAHLPPAGGRGE